MTHQGEVLLAVNGLKTYFNTDDEGLHPRRHSFASQSWTA